MALSAKKLYYKRNGTIYSVNLYTSQNDISYYHVPMGYIAIRVDGQTLFAPIDFVSESTPMYVISATYIRVMKNSAQWFLCNFVSASSHSVTVTVTTRGRVGYQMGISAVSVDYSFNSSINFKIGTSSYSSSALNQVTTLPAGYTSIEDSNWQNNVSSGTRKAYIFYQTTTSQYQSGGNVDISFSRNDKTFTVTFNITAM